MLLAEAKKKAAGIVEQLKPHCKEIMVCGSIRRKKPEVRDIDIVMVPSDPWKLNMEIINLSADGISKMSGIKIQRIIMKDGVQVDLYFATQDSWGTLLLIRTGSAAHNIKLCSRARSMGMHLHADGSGLFKIIHGLSAIPWEQPIATDEAGIFKALGMSYIEPESREV